MSIELKKRGRKPKNEYYSNKQIDSVQIENGAIIIHLPISVEKCKKMNFPIIPEASRYYIKGDYGKIEEVQYNTISPVTESSYVESEYINESKRIITEIYDIPIIKPTEKSNFLVNISCFWCCHDFSSDPVFMPMSYTHLKEEFNVKGCFCSFNCCLAYMDNDSKYKKNRFLLSHMYKIFTGESRLKPFDINPAPPRETLKKFGGFLSIEEYREFNEKINFKIREYPIFYVPTQIKKTSISTKEAPKKIFPIQKNEIIKAPIRSQIKNSLSKIISTKS
jgi:hypothetical protein